MKRPALAATLVWLAAACAHPAPSGELTLAEQNYFIHCMGCHGETGAGLEGQVPDLRKDLARLAALPGGRAYILRVPGVTQTSLEPDRTAEVLNYTLRRFGGAAVARQIAPFTAAEVAEARTVPLLEISATRAGVIEGRGLP